MKKILTRGTASFMAAVVMAAGILGAYGPASAGASARPVMPKRALSMNSKLRRLPVPANFTPSRLSAGKNAAKDNPRSLAQVSARSSSASLSPSVTSSGPYYFYAQGQQAADNEGAGAAFDIVSPGQVVSGTHSLAELALSNTSGSNVVEIGINKDPDLYGDTDTHLFVFSWENSVPQGYNGGNLNWVDASGNSIDAGSSVVADVGTLKALQWQHETTPVNAWWAYYNGSAIGYFPDTAWSNTFTQSNYVQLFGEIASTTNASPCTDMGTGAFPSGTGPARMGSLTYFGSATTPSLAISADHPSQYNVAYNTATTTRSIRYGGPGYC
ncbi:MAG TPA: neprosin family prolyl endopeptidase [Candidatus Saccharimonadales bacterium]|nr:neprosin family prolyl endopeptidase [Candidatus Saccharimonadales bacterium]